MPATASYIALSYFNLSYSHKAFSVLSIIYTILIIYYPWVNTVQRDWEEIVYLTINLKELLAHKVTGNPKTLTMLRYPQVTRGAHRSPEVLIGLCMDRFKIRLKTGNNLRFLLRSCNSNFKLSFFHCYWATACRFLEIVLCRGGGTSKNSVKDQIFVFTEIWILTHNLKFYFEKHFCY